MGWADAARKPGRTGLKWADADLNAAAAVCAAQLPVIAALSWLGTLNDDDPYGAGYDSAFGLACLLLFAPLVLWVLGRLHAAVHTMPAATLARLTMRRVGGPEWVWHLVFVGVLAAVWSVVGAALGGRPFLVGALWIGGFGVLPVFGVAYVRGRTRTTGRAPRGRRIWLGSALGSIGVSVVVVVAGTVAQSTGLIKEYEPPKLSAGQLAGVWRGGHGAVLRLGTGGRAGLTKVAAEPGDRDPGTTEFAVCGGTGTWFLDTDGVHDHYSENGPGARDGVVVTVPGCGDATFWTIGGSEDEPELYVLFGDPDSGDLRRLTRD
jgi:hypothetical protein